MRKTQIYSIKNNWYQIYLLCSRVLTVWQWLFEKRLYGFKVLLTYLIFFGDGIVAED